MFIKKRKDLPEAPGGASQNAFGLFKDASTKPAPLREVLDVVDVEVVEATEPVSSAAPPTAQETGSPKIKVRRKAPVAEPLDVPVAKPTKAPLDVETESPRRKLFKFGEKKQEASAAREPEKSVSSAKVKRAKVSGVPPASLDIAIGLEDGSTVFWRVKPDALDEVNSSEVTLAASFSPQDLRLRAEGIKSHKGALDLVMSEVGDDVRVVFKPKSSNIVYATTTARVLEHSPTRIGPGALLIDRLIKDDWSESNDIVCCVLLKTSDDANGLAILYHGNTNGDLSIPQISVNPDNLNFVISQFASALKLNLETTKVVILGNADLLKEANELVGYPTETSWQGIPLSKVWRVSAVIGAIMATASVTFCGYSYLELSSAEKKTSSYTAKLNATKSEVDVLLSTSLKSFAKLQTLNLPRITERAGEVWTPGAKVSLEATSAVEKYVTTLPLLNKGSELGGTPSVLNQQSMDNIEPLIKLTPPEGCVKTAPEISGGLNVVQVTVNCENTDRPVRSYSLN